MLDDPASGRVVAEHPQRVSHLVQPLFAVCEVHVGDRGQVRQVRTVAGQHRAAAEPA